MILLARIVFAVLVAATFGAFFVAQRLKHTPPVVQAFHAPGFFSPNGDGRFDREPISFRVKHTDDVTVQVVDSGADVVRTLLRNRRLVAYHQLSGLRWDGRTETGGRAPDGSYRVRVTLRREGRSVVVPRSFALDATPPRPRVTAIGPQRDTVARPELLPNREGRAVIHLLPAGRHAELLVFKTAPGRARLVSQVGLRAGQTRVAWTGRVHGRAVSPGTYLAVVRWRDRAGNVGASAPLDRRSGLPVVRYGEALGGHGGITVRYLEVQPPVESVAAGAVATFGIDARGARYRWTLRRVGSPRPVRRGEAAHSPFHVHAPGGRSGVYLLEVHTRRHGAAAPLAVQGAPRAPVLVVLPVMTWQGRNPVDDDGDGAPDLLDRGLGVRVGRVLQGGQLPAGFARAEGPLLAFLTRNRRRFDVTTDVALALGRGPKLAGHRGVVLPGDVRWLPPRVALSLRRFVRGGGVLLSLGLDSLRRDVRITRRGRLVDPTAQADSDVFGARLRPVVRRATTLTNLEDQLQLFSGDVFGGTGVFRGFPGFEATASLGPSEQLAASAVTGDGQTVIVAARLGRGLVIRTGLLDFANRLGADANSAQLVLRAWTLLSRR